MKNFAALPFAPYQSTLSSNTSLAHPYLPANSFVLSDLMENIFSILSALKEMKAVAEALHGAAESILADLGATISDPTDTARQVTQQQVNALVELSEAIDKAQLDSEARKRASLHWLILYEQMRLKNDETPQARGALDLHELLAHAHKRLGAVRHEEVDAFADWMSRQTGGQESSGFEPLEHIRAHASANESGEGGSLDCISSAGFSI